MISLNSISKHYSGNYLFENVSLRIGDNERIAVVGSNGSGKSTLMKIITGDVEADEGNLAQSRTNSVGYLPQDGVHHSGRSLFDEAASAFDDIIAMHVRVDQLSVEISELSAEAGKIAEAGKPDDETVEKSAETENRLHALVEELGEIQHVLEHREGYNIQTKVAQVLAGLGFDQHELHRQTDEFSGGWQMRIALAKLLLREPTILLLDEPTNHLDLESLEWLEQYLLSYEHSIVLISHDRRFLDTLARRVLEISMGSLTEYSGNFSYYVQEKALRTDQLRAAHANQQQHIKETQRFIERFRYKNTKSRQVQSRVKMLEKLDLIELEDEEGGISFDFPEPPQPGRVLMEVESLGKSYGDLEVFSGVNLTIERSDRIAFLGVNGAGKSTLARIMAGIEPYQEGTCRPGHNCAIGYYAQNQAEELDPSKTVLQTLDDVAVGDVRKRLRNLLGCFLFSGDDVFKKVSVLSGGEKSRLALAKMMLTPSNLLILDEPTNHLDLRSKTVLQDALLRFTGSWVIVSHDRDFLEPLTEKCIDFRDGEIRMTLGSVSDYLHKRHAEVQEDSEKQRDSAGRTVMKKNAQHTGKERKREEAGRRQEQYKKLKPLKNTLSKVEKRIEDLEVEKAGLEEMLGLEETYRDDEKARQLSSSYKTVQDELTRQYSEWEQIHEEIDSLS